MTAADLDIPPGPGFVIGVTAATGVHLTQAGEMAQLLITHPGPRRAIETVEDIEDGMRRLATGLRLGPGLVEPPTIGPRLMIRRGLAALDYGHDGYVMAIPSPLHGWLQLVTSGGPCRICLVTAPLALTATQTETDAHIRSSLARGQVLWGTTHARRRWSL
ncbi:hypothetical protein H9Y04_16125 [Streptomyces sp. TRM66268-LWL]|uniref:IclR-ED domain-containing protein n=1 Tax=Streptomyces polyasparticus TaxID=2767826 RepID=A0ABR7SF08_9ACTN|nr:hypothetical protein [Streptomyces polyasparticus]MBC9714091.1 hypothetical protein [Streptomyces polyasparticus]